MPHKNGSFRFNVCNIIVFAEKLAFDKNKIGQVGSRQGKKIGQERRIILHFLYIPNVDKEMRLIFCVFTVEDSDLTESHQYRAGQGIIPHVPYLHRRDP